MPMQVRKFSADTLKLDPSEKVAKPVGSPIPEVSTFEVSSALVPSTTAGVWECSPGRFERAVIQAEMCHFIEGEGSFAPEGGASLDIRPGDVLLFPANTRGVWDARKTLRKIFVVFDEKDAR